MRLSHHSRWQGTKKCKNLMRNGLRLFFGNVVSTVPNQASPDVRTKWFVNWAGSNGRSSSSPAAERRSPQPVHAGVNKGRPATHSPAPSSFADSERSGNTASSSNARASGLTLVPAGIALEHDLYIERAVRASSLPEQPMDPALLKYLSPLGWKHINLKETCPLLAFYI